MRVIGDATLLERVSGCKPNLVGLPKWGQRIWVHSSKSSKLQKHAMIVCWIGYDQGSPHAHWIYWLEMWSVTAERNVRFTADFTTVYTLPRPIQDLPPATPAPNPISQPALQVVLQTPPAQSSQPPQRPQPPLATSSGEEEVKVEDKLEDSNSPTPATLKARKSKAAKPPPAQPTHQSV